MKKENKKFNVEELSYYPLALEVAELERKLKKEGVADENIKVECHRYFLYLLNGQEVDNVGLEMLIGLLTNYEAQLHKRELTKNQIECMFDTVAKRVRELYLVALDIAQTDTNKFKLKTEAIHQCYLNIENGEYYTIIPPEAYYGIGAHPSKYKLIKDYKPLGITYRDLLLDESLNKTIFSYN